MKLEFLETYNAVMLMGTTQAAAINQGISQSAVSRRISQLESELGVSLFLRENSRLVPSAANLALRSEIGQLLDATQRLNEQAASIVQGNYATIRLRIAFPGSLGLSILPRIVAEFLQGHDRVRLEVHNGPYDTIERMLLDGRAELGFIRLPAGHAGLHITPAIGSRTVCVMPKDHPLARQDSVGIRDLRGVSMILLGRERAPRREIDELFWRAGIEPHIRVEAHSVAAACGLVANGIGVSLVNETMATDYLELPIHIRPLQESVGHYFAFATPGRGTLSSSAKAFIKTANTVLRDMTPPH